MLFVPAHLSALVAPQQAATRRNAISRSRHFVDTVCKFNGPGDSSPNRSRTPSSLDASRSMGQVVTTVSSATENDTSESTERDAPTLVDVSIPLSSSTSPSLHNSDHSSTLPADILHHLLTPDPHISDPRPRLTNPSSPTQSQSQLPLTNNHTSSSTTPNEQRQSTASNATTTTTTTPASPPNGNEAASKLAEALDDFLGDVERKFKGISEEILARLDEMAERCDRLEGELMRKEAAEGGAAGGGGGGGDRSGSNGGVVLANEK